MSNNYLDVAKKIQYYKQKVLNDLIKQGVYPDNALIESRLESIDSYLALFKNYNVVPGKNFNANEYNERLKIINTDLTYLYELLYELTVKEYYKLQNFINAHLSELNSIVETYNKRSEYENNSTTLGKTLLFQNNSFSIDNNNSVTKVNLGKVDIENAATVACIANINNVAPENIVFKFRKDNEAVYHNTCAYNYNNDVLVIPGKKKTATYNYTIQEGQNISGPLLINIGSVDIKNKYTILGGENKIFVNYKDNEGFIVEEKPLTIDSLSFNKKAYINFYIVGGNTISFTFNKKPIATNFPIDTQRITDLDYIHHFYIECDEDFSFKFEIDKGKVFAIKEHGVISNNNLYYTGSNQISDFYIIETSSGDSHPYQVIMEAYNSNEDLDIESIIIKQLE